MSWNNTLAHKLSIAYWAIHKQETHGVILLDPKIKDLSLFNPVISDDLRKNEMRIVAGEFLKHFAQLDLAAQPDGTDLDSAFDQLVAMLAEGKKKISATGDLIDSVYRFMDET